MVTLIGPVNGLLPVILYGLLDLTAIVMGFLYGFFRILFLVGPLRVAGGPYSIVTNLSGVSTGGLVAYTKLVIADPQQFFCVGTGIVFE